jgi:hypothetical protein
VEATDARVKRAREKYEAGIYGENSGPPSMRSLNYEAQKWPTPQAHDAVGGKTPEQVAAMKQRTKAGVRNLNEVAPAWVPTKDGQWQTPRAQELSQYNSRDTGQSLSRQVKGLDNYQSSHLDQTNATNGKVSRKSPGPRLNPVFVSWLMGWPLIVLAGSNSWAMESARFKQVMRSYLFGLLSKVADSQQLESKVA